MKPQYSGTSINRIIAGLTLSLSLALSQANSKAATCDEWVAQGRAALAARNLTNANTCFSNAVAQCPNDPKGNVFYAATRLLTLADQPAGKALLDRLGFAATNRSVYGWTAYPPCDTNGAVLAPTNMSAAELSAFVRTNTLAEVIAAAGNLAKATDSNFTLDLTSDETTTVAVTLDYGDLLLLRSGLHAAQCAAYTVCSWNLDVQLTALRSLLANGAPSRQEFLAQYPGLFTFTSTDDLGLARQAFTNAVALYLEASDFIRGRPTNVTRLFNYNQDEAEGEADFRTTLVDLNESLNGPVVLTMHTNYTAHLGNLFTGINPPRSFFPQLAGDSLIAGTLPDATLGGVIQGVPSYEWEGLLGHGSLDNRFDRTILPFVSQFTVPQRLPGGRLQITLNALNGSFFMIQVSTNLHTWSDLAYGVAQQGLLSFTDTDAAGSAPRFYRAVDFSPRLSVNGTVLDVITSNPIPNALVVLSFPYAPSMISVTNRTDSAGGFLAVSQTLPPTGMYQIDVSATGYASFETYGSIQNDRHPSMLIYLAPPGFHPTNDSFYQPIVLNGTNVTTTGYNVGATTEPGEPSIGAGQTVWWRWTAPAGGAVTIDTIGSSFPTVLAVFTGNAVSNLTAVATDAGSGGGGASMADFFVTAGTTYYIAVDAYWGGFPGRITLHLRYTAPRPPRITLRPKSATVYVGDWVSFWTTAAGTAPLSYQWRKDGVELPGATDPWYQIPDVQTNDAGAYTVVVSNSAGSTSAPPAILTVIGPPANDAFTNRIVITGTSNTVTGYNVRATAEPGEDYLGAGQTVWWTWTAPFDGAITVDTIGSSFNTALAIYTGDAVTNLTLLAAGVGSGGSGPSVVDFFVKAGTAYQISVDTYSGSPGSIVLNLRYTVPRPPHITLQPQSQTVYVGDQVDLSAMADGTQPLSFQWRKDGLDLPGEIIWDYWIAEAQTSDAGTYTVVVSNAVGSVTSTPPAVLTVKLPPYFLQVIHSFPEPPTPNSLARGMDGAFYGTVSGGGSGGFGTIFRLTTNGTLTTLGSFGHTNGAHPHGPLVQGFDGAFYGTTSDGGAWDAGTVFRVSTNGLLTTVASLSWSYGAHSLAGLVQGNDGAYYGTASQGGSPYGGTVFRVTTNGDLTRLVSFGDDPNGSLPYAPLLLGSDGAFYGTTVQGGANGFGSVFRVTTNGQLTTLASFANTNGLFPSVPLAWGPDGALYGTTALGGANDQGTVFRVTTNGVLTTLVSFDPTSAAWPAAGLLPGADGLLYGTTSWGGGDGSGTVFSVNTNGDLTTLASLTYDNGSGPDSRLVMGEDGALYGTAASGGAHNYGTVFRVTTAGALTNVISFANDEGSAPAAGMVQGQDGALYGTTQYGGDTGYGLVFRVTTNGTLTTVASFNDENGAYPAASLTAFGDGMFYGTTHDGGYYGVGTVFQATTNGDLTTLATFDYDNGYYPHGYYPQAGLVVGGDGALYGTAANGGDDDYGTVFRVTTDGDLSTIVSFAGTDGATPSAALLLASDGAFYGTTKYGCADDYGTVFRVTTNGALTTLVSFAGTNGAAPTAGLVWGSDGALYGTTSEGGINDSGTVFRVTTKGALTTLVSFAGTNGAAPTAELVWGSDGALYGTTQSGGEGGYGTVFRITTDGALTTLGSFNSVDGSRPGALVQAADGNLYGTCAEGGSRGGGNIFRVAINSAGVSRYSPAYSKDSQLRRVKLDRPRAGLSLGNRQRLLLRSVQ